MLRARFALFLAPLCLYLGWLLLKALLRRKPSRFEVTVGLSVLLLLYFLVVVGTGIFWVAAQELPVFDWHYLPGYVLLLLALAHVVLHWKSVAAFLRRGAPAGLKSEDGNRFTGWLRYTGYGLVGLLAGGACFFAGTRFGSPRFHFSGTEGAWKTTQAMGSEGDPIRPKYLKASPVTSTLSQLYHQGCAYPNTFELPGLTLQGRPPVTKDYGDKPTLPLPDPKADSPVAVGEAYLRWVSGEGRDGASLSLTELSQLLHHSQGIRETLEFRGRSFDFRTAASAGALYPVNLYVLAQRVEGLAPGLYHYNPKLKALVSLDPAARSEVLAAASGSPEAIRSAPATVIYTVTFGRTAFKYRDRSYRYVNMDTGHAAYNLALCAAALGLRAPLSARFDDDKVQALLGLNATEEGALLVQPLGAAAEPEGQEPRFHPVQGREGQGSFIDLIHGGTAFTRGKTLGRRLAFPPMDRPGEGRISLPAPEKGKGIHAAILARKSIRDFSERPMSKAQLSALCQASSGYGRTPGFQDPLLGSSAPLDLRILVRSVEGLEPGIYRYHPADHSLEPLKQGAFSSACMKASLEQEFCGTAQAVFLKVVTWSLMEYPDGDRGYRYACLRAGLMGEGLYVQGAALGLGVCGVGAFEDGSIGKLLGLDPKKEACLYLTAVGTR